ncbi:MAG: hypothetical protein ACHP7P_03895 [Terriglobales bacterium]
MFLFVASCTGHTQATAAPPPKSSSDCAAQIRRAVKEADTKGREEGFSQGFGIGQFSMANFVSDRDHPPLKMELLMEEFSGADSYRLAVAEIAKQYFSDFIVIDPVAPLKVYVSGTNYMGAGRAQYVNVEVMAFVQHRFVTGSKSTDLHGTLKISETGQSLTGYDDQERARIMREMAYKVLSDFKAKWTEAAAKGKTD